MNVRIHIERLVLTGLPVSVSAAPHIKSAVEAELARLLSDGALAPDVLASATPVVQGNTLHLAEGAAPGEVGTGIARAVYGGIGS